jgi:DNA primase
MIAVESPLDVVRLASVGITGGVATYGAIVSTAQFNLLRGAERLIFALDNDNAGQSASMTMLELCKEMGKEAWFFNYSHTDMKDVGAMSKVEIESGLETAKHMVRGKV